MTTHRLTPIALAALLACPYLVPMAQAQEKNDTKVPVERVTLYTSGVGMFTHSGSVDGDATATLRFPAEQIDDILKSLALVDLDGGRVGTVTYPSSDPLGKTLGSFQIDLRDGNDMAAILRQLRGAAVTVTAGGQTVTGEVLGVETEGRSVDEEVVQVEVLTLFGDEGLRSFVLSEVSGVKIVDEQLRAELRRALSAVDSARGGEKKPVTLDFAGEGQRRVTFGYVVEAPVWKSSYRLILGSEGAADLQGWAIVENQTDFDWEGVQLSLVSGRPISFKMGLYEPIYLPRPTVVQQRFENLGPVAYGGGVEADAEVANMMMAREAPAAAAPAMRARGQGSANLKGIGGGSGMQAAASAGESGALFEYTLPGVDLARQKSAMLPIVVEPIEAERLSIYDSSVLPKHPLSGARLTNTTDKHLPAGPVTLYDGDTYAGDAQLTDMPAGSERLVSYGVDQEVIAEANVTPATSLVAGKIVDGTLELRYLNTFTYDATFKNEDDEARTLIVVVPVQGSAELADGSPEPMEKADGQYRFRVTLPAGESTRFAVKQELTRLQELAVLGLDDNTLVRFVQTGEFDDDVKAALSEVLKKKRQVARLERRADELEDRVDAVAKEQERLRENLGTVDRNGDYAQRLLKKLDEQETQIEQLRAEQATLRDQAEAARRELNEMVSGLNV